MRLAPSILFNNVFDPVSKNEAEVMEYFEYLVGLDYYESIETRIIFDEKVRKEFAQLTKDNNINVSIPAVSTLSAKGYNLSDLNETNRKNSVNYLKELIDLGHEQNASYLLVNSGKIIDKTKIKDQEKQFEKSLIEVLEYQKKYPGMKLAIEPLDTDADKKILVGKSDYVKEVCEFVKENDLLEQFSLTLDTAHIALNNESIKDSLSMLSNYTHRIHLANAVLDTEDKLFGDKHLMVGENEPGFLTQELSKDIINHAKTLDFQEDTVYVSIEARSNKDDDLYAREKELRDFLSSVIS